MTLLKKITGFFTGKTIDAETGRVEQPVARISRPQTNAVARTLGLFLVLFAFALALNFATGYLMAQSDDISSTTASLSGYWTDIKTIAIAVVLFVLGRRLLRKV